MHKEYLLDLLCKQLNKKLFLETLKLNLIKAKAISEQKKYNKIK